MILHGEGKEALPQITEEILRNPDIDGGVVHSCVSYEEKLLLESVHQKNEEGLVAVAVETVIPQFDDVYRQVEVAWERDGYQGFELEGRLYFTDFIPRGRGISPHIDYYDNLAKFVQVGVSFSFSVGDKDSGAIIKVARPREACFRKSDRSIDVESLLGWQALVGADLVEWQEVMVGCGDVFILPQHCFPAGHGVVASETREAYILDYLAFYVAPDDEAPNKDVSS